MIPDSTAVAPVVTVWLLMLGFVPPLVLLLASQAALLVVLLRAA